MISKRDSKPFKIKFPIGITKENANMQYKDDWHTCYGLIRDSITGLNANIYGYEPMYDKVITLNAGQITRKINYDTLFIIDNIPTDVYKNGDYSAKRIYPEYNGEIVIGLEKKEAIDIPKLYFYYDDKLLYHQLNFDKGMLKAYLPSNESIPFNVGDYVWTREPLNKDTVNHRIKLESRQKTGLDSQFKNFDELVFVEE